MLNTYQGSYELLADASVDVTIFDGSADGYSYRWDDFSRNAFLTEITLGTKQVGTECNGIEIIALATGTAENEDSNFKLYGRTEGGPAEYLYDISMTVGTARSSGDNTTSLYVDTFTVGETVHFKNATVKNITNGIARLQFDFAGYKYLTGEMYDVSDGRFQVYFRVY
jgi:hypothetical protein